MMAVVGGLGGFGVQYDKRKNAERQTGMGVFAKFELRGTYAA